MKFIRLNGFISTVIIFLTLLGAILLTFRHKVWQGRIIDYKSNESFWDWSPWDVQEREALLGTLITMHELWDDLNIAPNAAKEATLLSSSIKKEAKEQIVDNYNKVEEEGVNTGIPMRGRRRLKESTNKGIEQTRNKWEVEANNMQDEFIQFFIEQKRKQHKKKEGRETVGNIGSAQKLSKSASKIAKGSKHDEREPFVLNTKRKIQEQYGSENPYSLNCTDPNALFLPCPSEDLPQKCDKYNGGDFKSCYLACEPSFCCIHDSKSDLAASCADEPNCRNWSSCYIVWWKLHDTIGPLSFVRLEQNDDFWDTPFQWVQSDYNIDGGNDVKEIFWQLFSHHWDDDTYKNEGYVSNPINW